MARRPDHGQDATQELSSSQILRDLPPRRPVPPKAKGAVNDVSMWGRKVVGSEEFAPMPMAPGRSRRWLIGGVLGAAAVAGAGYAVVSHTDDEPTAPAMVVDHTEHAPPAAPATPPPKPAVATKPAETKPAAIATGSGSAAPAPAAGSGSAALMLTNASAGVAAPADLPDAVSSVGTVVKPPVAKKPPIKTAAAPVTKRPPVRKPPARKAPPPPPKRRTR